MISASKSRLRQDQDARGNHFIRDIRVFARTCKDGTIDRMLAVVAVNQVRLSDIKV